MRDTVAEMAARAQEISLEAGSKIAAAMKDVIGAAAGLTGFALESARDLVQYMVRRGQMTQDEADKLIREVEDSQGPRRPRAAAPAPQPRADVIRPEPPRPDSDGKRHVVSSPTAVPVPKPPMKAAPKPAPRAAASARSAKKAAPRKAARKPTAAKKGGAKAKKKR